MQELHRKEAAGHTTPELLGHEALMLRMARHPGVVELLIEPDLDAHGDLVTGFAGDATLAERTPLRPEEAAGLLIALAETVADLHELGVVHGRVEPTHVLLAANGQPILCGFAGAALVGRTPPPGASPPPDELQDPFAAGGLQPSVDVYALGALLRSLVVGAAGEVEPTPERRVSLRRGRPWRGYLARALLTIADQATAEDPSARPSARELAAALRAAAPDAVLPAAPLPEPADPYDRLRAGAPEADGAPRLRTLTLAAAAAGIALIVFGVSSLRSAPGAPTSAAFSGPGLLAATSAAPDLERPLVAHDGAQFQVGAAGDVVVVDDWRCDGTPVAAVLRPSTGAVYLFDGWPDGTQDITAAPLGMREGAVALRAAPGTDGCPRLVAQAADGSTEEVVP